MRLAYEIFILQYVEDMNAKQMVWEKMPPSV